MTLANTSSLYLAVTIGIALLGLHSCDIIRDYCEPGWDAPHRNSTWCYKFVYDKSVLYNWYAARYYCQQQDSELLVIDDNEEASWLQEVFTKEQGMVGVHGVDSEAEAWYIDAHKQLYCADNEPCWRDGRPLNESDIFSSVGDSGDFAHCLSDEFTLLPACYAIGFKSYLFTAEIVAYDVNCSTNYRNTGFICKKSAVEKAKLIPQPCSHKQAAEVACPEGWRSCPHWRLARC